jgi:hypothetical protein
MPDDEFAAARRVISEEQEIGNWIRINVTFESHRVPLLHVKDDSVPVAAGGLDGFASSQLG